MKHAVWGICSNPHGLSLLRRIFKRNFLCQSGKNLNFSKF
ncbi:hypothetical protein EU91_1235 [Prochlorococcus marinus str. GP2]|uniref:Uncharacterized protein n=1 Tax=Prochlorococcus marinus str. GP2 TaxID=59925 RepID=A0A0A1ZDX0_PROMR|nr:hypothetical protein EU91_1235 [Prochlorococcus marinus str. GP2]